MTSIIVLILAITLVSNAIAKGYKIEFDSCGGSNCQSIYTEGNEVLRLPIPKRSGYIFEGWYPYKDGTGTKLTNSKYKDCLTTQNEKYYARWLCYKRVTLSTNESLLDYYMRIDTTSHYDSTLKQSTISVELVIGYYQGNNGMEEQKINVIKNYNITARVLDKNLVFTDGTTHKSFTTSKAYYAWSNIPVSNISGTFDFLIYEGI